MNTTERINELAENEGINITTLEKKIGASKGVLSRAINKNTDISSKWLTAIIDNFQHYSGNWLLNGSGPMLLTDIEAQKSTPDGKNSIPLIPAEAIAGFGNGKVSIKQSDVRDHYHIPGISNADFLIRVGGSSMEPNYFDGDLVACKLITERHFFQWGRVFVIHHNQQGAMVKRLFPGGDSVVICRSDNPEYPDFTLNLNELNNIALVLARVSVKMEQTG